MEGYINYLNHIKSLESKIEYIKLDIYDFIENNRLEFKKYMPIKNKIYLIKDIREAFEFNLSSYNFEFGEPYYFKVTNNHLYIEKFKQRGEIYVTGYILNSNMIRLREYSEEDIKIRFLSEYIELNSDNKQTFVYLILDKSTGYYKIGRSKNPKIRERTLQSEKPTLEMIVSFSGINLDEKNLHSLFKEKRIRGEWFDLSGSDIEKIHNYFNNKTNATLSQTHPAPSE